MIERKRKEKLNDVEDHWMDFHQSSTRTISYVTKRATGKTFNILKHAYQSDKDCIMFFSSLMQARLAAEEMVILDSNWRSKIGKFWSRDILFKSGRIVEFLFPTPSEIRGKRLKGKNIYVDEFFAPAYDQNFFEIIDRADRVLAAGSYHNNHNAIKWLNSCELVRRIK